MNPTQPQRITERRRTATVHLTVADLLELFDLWEEVEGRPLQIQPLRPPDYPTDSKVPTEDRIVYRCEIAWPEETE